MKALLSSLLAGLCLLFILPLAAQIQKDSAAAKATASHREIISRFFSLQAGVHSIYQTALSPNAESVAWNADEGNGQSIYIAALQHPEKAFRITASPDRKRCSETNPQWSPDGKEMAFLSDAQTPGQAQLFIANAATGELATKQPFTHFNGYVSHLQWSPDGSYLSLLYVEKASRQPSPMAAEDRATGIIDSMAGNNVQRIALINRKTGMMQQATPDGLYIFEYNWSPDSQQWAYTAAPPPGDDNWYIAKLYKQNVLRKDTTLVYAPAYQIALPRWSPDGKQIAFIEGLMSDQGATGGEIFLVDATGHNKRNLTPNRTSTPSWFVWKKDGDMLFTEFVGGSVAIASLHVANGAVETLWKADQSIGAGTEEISLSIKETKGDTRYAFIRTDWNQLPEVWAGDIKKLTQITHVNTEILMPFIKTENITWRNENGPVQGWLLYPQHYDAAKKYPMLVCVHGGPAWITTPTWNSPDFNTTVYTQLGYFVFFPNARGGYGQGEKFTLSNQRDWGFGDLRDIIAGVDTIVAKLPVDSKRVGILGWSYGGSMAMISVTQTNRFRASVSGAGAGDWLSYYGQNSIDKWMYPYFGVSPYDDPEPYRKVSAMTYIKNVKTPTLVLVGERDGECPSPQSFQYWHALKELGVPTQLVVYADEGHRFHKLEDMIDISARTLEWFETWMPAE